MKMQHARAMKMRRATKLFDNGSSYANHGHNSTNHQHTFTGNPATDQEIIDKSDASPKDTQECIPPKAMVGGECIDDPESEQPPNACHHNHNSPACHEWHKGHEERKAAYHHAIKNSGYHPYHSSSNHHGSGDYHSGSNHHGSGDHHHQGHSGHTSGGQGGHEHSGHEHQGHEHSGHEYQGHEHDGNHHEHDGNHYEHDMGALGVGGDGETVVPEPDKIVPQRFPHSSGADLGDNYVSGLSDVSWEDREFDDHFIENNPGVNNNHTPNIMKPFTGEKDLNLKTDDWTPHVENTEIG